MFVLNIVMGRWLGPEEYGRYGLVLSLGMIFMIPMLFGLNTSMIRYGSSLEGKEKNAVVSTALVSIFGLSATFFVIFYALREWIQLHFQLENSIFMGALFMAIGLTLYNAGDALLRVYHAFRTQAILLFLGATTALLWLLFAYLSGPTADFHLYLSAILIAYGVIFLGAFGFWIQRARALNVQRTQFTQQMHYGAYVIFGSVVGTLIMSVDRLMLNHYINPEAVGLYLAYNLSSTVILMKLMEMVVNVFFPATAKATLEGKKSIFRRLMRLMLLSFPFLIVFTGLSTVFTLYFYGQNYALDWSLLILFSIQAPLMAMSGLLAWFINTLGIVWIRHFTFFGFLMVFVNVLGNALLIPDFALHGAIFSSLLTYILYFIYGTFKIRRYFLHLPS